MANVLLDLPGQRHGFRVIRCRGGKYRLLETDGEFQTVRAVPISRDLFQAIMARPEADRYSAAARLFHEIRIAKRARRLNRETGGGNGTQA